MMDAFPALLLIGPRATGKTTTARRYAAGVARLDRPAERAAFQADRDAAELAGRDPARRRRYFEAVALNSAGVAEHKTLYDAAAIDRKTADAYERLLVNLLVLELLPAWLTNRLSRLVKAPKRYLVDPGLLGA